jgi:transglutaminase-like putative cysteine protease
VSPAAAYLEPSPGVASDHPRVAALARELAAGAAGPAQVAAALFAHAREAVRYSPFVPFHRIQDYEAPAVLARGKGYCVQKSALLAALARAAGIPARLGFADIANHQLPEGMAAMLGTEVMAHHCYAELWLAGAWRKATPSFEAPLCAARGWRLVEFAPKGDALLPASDLAGRPHITYLRHHGHRAGVPLEEILAAWRSAYGAEKVAGWQAAAEAGEGWT